MAFDGDRPESCTRRIPLAEIECGDERFRITTRRSSDDLDLSLQRLGLLAAPLLLPRDRGYILVSGFRRVDACRRLGWGAIPARVLEAPATMYACALKSVGENSLERPLNLIETSRALRLLDRHAPGGNLPPEDASALGLPTHAGLAARLKTLCRMPAEVQDAVLDETLSFAMAYEIGQMEAGLAVAFARLFRRLKTGLNKQREIVTLVSEIARREGIDSRTVLSDPGLLRVQDAEDLDRSQKTQSIRRLLRRRRFPTLTTAEDRFHALHRRLELGANLQLSPPRDFEGTRYTLTLSFEHVEEVDRLRAQLDALVRRPDFKALLTGKGRGFAGTPVP
jgi:ParB family transcriptional regulator, chromosome partitioning protein